MVHTCTRILHSHTKKLTVTPCHNIKYLQMYSLSKPARRTAYFNMIHLHDISEKNNSVRIENSSVTDRDLKWEALAYQRGTR